MSFEINETEYAIVDAVEKVCREILQTTLNAMTKKRFSVRKA